jgi:transposase
MAKPYSYDRRCKVMAAIAQDGMKRCEASTVFQISRNTINCPATWAKTGH